MTSVTVHRDIDAPAERVFQLIADLARLPERDPDVIGVELLSSGGVGVGTRFRETRRMKGRAPMVTELEVTEFVADERVRMVTDSHGTVWDSLFRVEPIAGRTRLTITMEARAHKLLPRLLNPLLKGMFRKGITGHLDALKRRCEGDA
ncbi:MAG: SRPBCC family protein [Nannocystaceae bacterium]|nr:SRPBCC family protein [Myxococcales bacterium]